ncbi:MAG: hypothetical protein AAGJ79_10760 [Verrucomicrobiota bacterium]
MILFRNIVSALAALGGILHGQEAVPPEIPDVMGSLYMDEWQVEKEFIVNPVAMQTWIDLGLRPTTVLDAASRERLKPRLGEFFSKHWPVSIADEPLEFELDRVQFIEADTQERIVLDPEASVAAGDAVVSVVFVAPLPEAGGRVNFRWDLFPEENKAVQIFAADPLGTRIFNIDQVSPELSLRARIDPAARAAPEPPPAPPEVPRFQIPWTHLGIATVAMAAFFWFRARRKPGTAWAAVTVAVGLTAAGLLPLFRAGQSSSSGPDNTELILDRVLHGIYHAFNFRDESAQYDVLANVAGGDVLTEIYLEARRTLETRQQDGSRVRVKAVEVKAVTSSPLEARPGFNADCEWEVSGKIGHWGHFHDRTNRYSASFSVEPLENKWKITALNLLNREREIEQE